MESPQHDRHRSQSAGALAHHPSNYSNMESPVHIDCKPPGFFLELHTRTPKLLTIKRSTFRRRNYLSLSSKKRRHLLLYSKCMACKTAKAPVTCVLCQKDHCYKCCFSDFDICMACVLINFTLLLRVQNPNNTLALDSGLSRRIRTELLTEKAPFLSACHLCHTTGLHKLCEKCVQDTCDACIDIESCRCADCLGEACGCGAQHDGLICGRCGQNFCTECIAAWDLCTYCAFE